MNTGSNKSRTRNRIIETLLHFSSTTTPLPLGSIARTHTENMTADPGRRNYNFIPTFVTQFPAGGIGRSTMGFPKPSDLAILSVPHGP